MVFVGPRLPSSSGHGKKVWSRMSWMSGQDAVGIVHSPVHDDGGVLHCALSLNPGSSWRTNCATRSLPCPALWPQRGQAAFALSGADAASRWPGSHGRYRWPPVAPVSISISGARRHYWWSPVERIFNYSVELLRSALSPCFPLPKKGVQIDRLLN